MLGVALSDPCFEDQWRRRFEEFAQSRDDDAGIAGWSATGLDARVRRFDALWSPVEHGLWLDAGCAAGTYTRMLLRHGQQVVAADYSLTAIRKALLRDVEGASFVVADIRNLPFRPQQFDGILCLGVMQALAESESALRELSRLLRPGGHLWIDALNAACVVHTYERWRRHARGLPLHLRYESPRRLLRTAQRSGLADIRLHWMPIVPQGARAMQRILESRPVDWLFRNVSILGASLSHAFLVHARKP